MTYCEGIYSEETTLVILTLGRGVLRCINLVYWFCNKPPCVSGNQDGFTARFGAWVSWPTPADILEPLEGRLKVTGGFCDMIQSIK